jgi:hypothetical protein
MRDQAEDIDAVGAVVPPPHKPPRAGSARAGSVRNPAPQRAGPSGSDELSSGDSRDPASSISSGTSEPLQPPVDNHQPASPTEAHIPSHQYLQAPNVASDEGTADGWDAVIQRVNPSRGPMTGGLDIWIVGSNFPTGELYARFGDNFAHTVGVLSLPLGNI